MSGNNKTVFDLVNKYFSETINGKQYQYILPLTSYIDKKSGEKIFKGAKSDMTKEQHITLKNTGQVEVEYKNKGTGIYKYECSIDKSELLELHMRCIKENLCIIDIDDEKIKLDEIPKIFKDLPYTLSRNKKLPHYFFILDGVEKKNLTEKVLTCTKCLKFCKGDLLAGHVWENPKSILYEFDENVGLPIIHIEEIKQYFDEKTLKKMGYIKDSNNQIKSKKLKEIDDSEESTDENDDTETVINDYNLHKDETDRKLEKLKKISQCYKNERFNSYETWFKFTVAMKNTFGEKGKDLWDELSQKGSSYNRDKNLEHWSNIQIGNSKDKKKLNFGSLVYWAKEDNEELYNEIIKKFININWERLTDNTFADMMYKLYFKDRLIFTYNLKKEVEGYFYNDTYWLEMGKNNSQIKRGYFRKLYSFYIGELQKIKDELDEKKYGEYYKKVLILDSAMTRNNIIKILQDELFVDNIEWNKNKYLFAFNNKIYDLEKGKFTDPHPKQYINYTCGYDYEDYDEIELENAKKVIYDFIDGILDNLTKKEQKNYLMKLLSSFLVQLNKEEKGYFWLGRGRNGKGTLTNLLISCLGRYFGELQIEYYTTYSKGADAPNQNLFNNYYSRILNTSEISDEDMNGDTVKIVLDKFLRITGRDMITARGIHSSDTVSYIPGKILIQTNNLPVFTTIKDNVVERLVIFTFPFTFTDDDKKIACDPSRYKKVNTKLKDLFSTNIYRMAFIEMLFDCYKIYQKEGLKEPESIIKNRDEYIDTSNNFNTWFQEKYQFKEDAENIKLKDVVALYKYENEIQKFELEKAKKSLLNMHGYDNYIKTIKGYVYLKHHVLIN